MSNDPSQVRVLGPLAAYATGFAGDLARQGYTPNSASFQMRLLAHLSRWLQEQGRGAGDLHTDVVDCFLRARRAAGYTSYLSHVAVRPILGYLRGLKVAPPQPAADEITGPVDVALERFRRYLTVERALADTSAYNYLHAIRPFLESRVLPEGLALDFGQLTAGDVISFVVARCPRQTHSAAKQTVKALRSFLRFLHVEGVIAASLVDAVPTVADRQLAGLPKGLESDQVRRLLASCDDNTRSGLRAIAILTTLVRLGMRAGEVARLQLDDIDWRAGEIIVHGKGSRIERLPIPPDVGGAIAAYLKHARPATAQGRTLFVRISAPHHAVSSSGVSCVVARAARKAGLGRVYAHRLRHTAATQMLRAGASLPEIGQVLRHRSVMTTAIYAKADREALRTIARSWPGDVA